MKKKRHGHYCIICGEYKANEQFSGKGHAAHICRKCQKIPKEERDEILAVNRLMDILICPKRNQCAWVDQMRKDDRKNVRETAELVYAKCFSPFRGKSEEDEWRFDLEDEPQEDWKDDTETDWDDCPDSEISFDDLPF